MIVKDKSKRSFHKGGKKMSEGTDKQSSLLDSVRRHIEDTPLDELGEVFEIIATRVFQHRQENRGFVPLEIFPYCVGIGGGYLCAEIVVIAEDGSGFYLKKRVGEDELGWKGQFQIPGTSIRTTDNPEDVFERLSDEISSESGLRFNMYNAAFIGIETHNEPERMATCWTAVWQIVIPKDLDSSFSGEWEFFSQDDLDNEKIIDHHRNTLKWAAKKTRDIFVDLR